MYRPVIITGIIFFLLVACNGKRPNENPQRDKTFRMIYYRVKPRVKLEHPAVFDTFQTWKQFFRYWDMPDSINREELKDKTGLIRNAMTRIAKKPFPPEIDTVDVHSRFLWLDNETRQLDWLLGTRFVYPETDSIVRRWLQAYESLVNQINFFTGEKENFEMVFREKVKRDSLLMNKFKRDSIRRASVKDSLQGRAAK